MVEELREVISGDALVSWLAIGLLVAYFVYKEWPDFLRRVSHGPLRDERSRAEVDAVESRLCTIEMRLAGLETKIGRDFERINEMERTQKLQKKIQEDGQEELEIIMRALLGVLRGLQEQGANGPTKEAEAEITDYLTRKAHSGVEEE